MRREHRADDGFRRSLQQLLRPGGRFLQRDGAVCDGVEAVHAVLIQRLRVRAHAAGEHTDRNVALPLCRLRHAHGYLAEQRLTVRSALARDDQIGVLNLSGEVLQLEYHVDAPPELGVHKGVQRRAQTAGGSGTRAIGHVRAELRAQRLGVVEKRPIQPLRHLWRCALLRAIYPRGPLRAAQHVLHIAGHRYAAVRQPGIHARDVHDAQPFQRRAAEGKLSSRRVPERHAQRLRHARAAVVCGGAAQADEEFPASRIQRRAHQLAGAVGGGEFGAARLRLRQRQPGGGTHLDDRDAVVQNGEAARHAIAHRPRRLAGRPFAALRVEEGFEHAVPAVRNRQVYRFDRRIRPQNSPAYRRARDGRRAAALVGIHGYNNFHLISRSADFNK